MVTAGDSHCHIQSDAEIAELCRIANERLLKFLRRRLRRPAGRLGMVMTIHTFSEQMGYNCHIHALVADGLFTDNGMFVVANPEERTADDP